MGGRRATGWIGWCCEVMSVVFWRLHFRIERPGKLHFVHVKLYGTAQPETPA